MKRFITILLGVLALCMGLALPAQAGNEWGRPIAVTTQTVATVPTATDGWEWGWEWGNKIPCDKSKMCKTAAPAVAQATPDTVDTAGNGFAMGVLPNYWTLCVANGYGPTVSGPVLGWNYPGRALTISLRNVCTGYSITNRMTIDNVNNAGACIQYSNLGHTPNQMQHWGPYYWVWNQNPVIWVNTRSGCNNAGGQLEHNAAKGVGYILGLVYGTCTDCVMGPDNNLVTRATNGDSLDANTIYQMP